MGSPLESLLGATCFLKSAYVHQELWQLEADLQDDLKELMLLQASWLPTPSLVFCRWNQLYLTFSHGKRSTHRSGTPDPIRNAVNLWDSLR